MPKHKKNAELGTKNTVYSSVIYLEQEDAQSFENQEEVHLSRLSSYCLDSRSFEVTLMDWGNAIIKSKEGPTDGITSISADLHLAGDFKKTKKKITWLAESTSSHPLAEVTLLDYDYLITKKKLEEGDNVEDFVTPTTEFRVEAFADANVLELKKGDIMQFERKGYYILDGIIGDGKEKRLEFIKIPDGKAAGLASKAGGTAVPPGDAPKPKAATGAKGWGKSAGPATGKAPAAGEKTIGQTASGFKIPVTTTMYESARILAEGDVQVGEEVKMYHVNPIN